MKKIFLGVLVAGLVLAPVLAGAATFKTGDSYYLDPGSVIDDNLYSAGGEVLITGQVNGDLMAAGGTITISGPVQGDVAVAGGTLNISGKVSGDTRVAGGNIIILNSTGGELVAAGGQISVLPGSSIGKDAKIAGGQINFAGDVAKKLVIKGETVYVNGKVGGDLSVEAREVKLGPGASVAGNFDYSSVAEAKMEAGASVKGETNFKKIDRTPKEKDAKGFFLGFIGVAWIVKTIMFIVAGLVLVYLFSVQTKSVIGEATSRFWKEALRGFVVLVVVPVAAILCFITVIGVPIGFILLLLYMAAILLSAIMSILVFGQLAAKHVFKKQNYQLNWWVVILAALALGLISLIPFVGWIFTFIIFLSAFGSTTNFIYKKLKS